MLVETDLTSYLSSLYETTIVWFPAVKLVNLTEAIPLTTPTVWFLPSTPTVTLPLASLGKTTFTVTFSST